MASDVIAAQRARSTGHVFMVLLAVGCGLAGALGAVIFRFMIRFVQAAFFEGATGLESLFEEGLLAEAAIRWTWRAGSPGGCCCPPSAG